jgi:hypothetical protein
MLCLYLMLHITPFPIFNKYGFIYIGENIINKGANHHVTAVEYRTPLGSNRSPPQVGQGGILPLSCSYMPCLCISHRGQCFYIVYALAVIYMSLKMLFLLCPKPGQLHSSSLSFMLFDDQDDKKMHVLLNHFKVVFGFSLGIAEYLYWKGKN